MQFMRLDVRKVELRLAEKEMNTAFSTSDRILSQYDKRICAYKGNNSGQAQIPVHGYPLSKSARELLNRVVPNGTLHGVEGEGRVSPIRFVIGHE